MGLLTTVTFHNDGIDSIVEDSDGFCRALRDLVAGGQAGTIGCGSHANLVKVQMSKHVDGSALYVQKGGEVYELNPYLKETQNLMREHPEFFKEIIGYLKDQTLALERQYRAVQRRRKG